ncbi:MAG: hypothetical protein GY714_26635 [Desulfobacterales bacterium]|nr:hypothetical protein [Desulfobacterales bacterium]MCP4159469.1 hypothetical protein [Deltaproteobacteria bacterium]
MYLDSPTKPLISFATKDILIKIKSLTEKNQTEKIQIYCSFELDDFNILDISIKTTFFIKEKLISSESKPYDDIFEDLSNLYREINDLEEILFEVTPNSYNIFTNPLEIESGFRTLKKGMFQYSSEAIDIEKDVIESRIDREKFYKNIGANEKPIYRAIREHRWPGNITKYSVIHTDKSTVLITDGLSDCFKNRNRGCTGNGYSLEFYMEFEGTIDRIDFLNHYSFDILHQISQITVKNEKLQNEIKDQGSMVIQLNGLISIPDKYMDLLDNYGVLLNVKSENIPSDMQLNKEKVLLVSCKLIPVKELQQCLGDKFEVKKLNNICRKHKLFNYNPFDFSK